MTHDIDIDSNKYNLRCVYDYYPAESSDRQEDLACPVETNLHVLPEIEILHCNIFELHHTSPMHYVSYEELDILRKKET